MKTPYYLAGTPKPEASKAITFSEENILASITRESFYDFLVEFWDIIVGEELSNNWHIKYICDELQVVAERVFKGERSEYDLVINVPPGSTKSTICSQAFPAWVWTRMPSAKFICGSYAHQVALKDSLKTRDIVMSERYQKCFGIQLREDENTKGLFTNTKMGFRLAIGVGGFVTGIHGHILIVDDPINPEEAFSDVELKAANRWMTGTLSSRKVDKRVTPTILIQQRLHQADPSGEMLARAGREKAKIKVKHICLPGELSKAVSPPDLATRYVDGLLDPTRLPRDVLEKMAEEMGAYGYASQILQDPVPLGGGMFETDKLKLEDDYPKLVREVRSWDKAGTEDGGMFSVGMKMGLDKNGRYWIVDVRRGQWGATRREERILQTAEEDGEAIEIVLEIEGGSGGKESGENTVKMLAGYRCHAFHPTGDKEARAYPLASQVGAGNVYVLKRSWTKDLIEEMKYFPYSKYKDQVDAASGAFNRLAKKPQRIGVLFPTVATR
jgi:predicted phage terminase large subunit-like protein